MKLEITILLCEVLCVLFLSLSSEAVLFIPIWKESCAPSQTQHTSELHPQQVIVKCWVADWDRGAKGKKEKSRLSFNELSVLSVPDAHYPQRQYWDSIQDLRMPRETQQDTERGVTTSLNAPGVEPWTHICMHIDTHTHTCKSCI